jgi:diaminohydroxyphosphoribosylaminopyrimidine deaminase/5-amino-6-(5-phosphoribosylamino)uracil reductase
VDTEGGHRADSGDADRAFMRRALDLAEAGWGRVHPNPLVGAVVVKDGVVVGEGAHREYGGPHGEIEALEAAGDAARGATLYVTLEPCAHHGKTPACTEAILRHGIRRLVFAATDPHPEAGGGGAMLAARGLEVLEGVERDRARSQNALFLQPLESGRPFVAVKFGLTLDSRIAERAAPATRITGPAAEAEVHRLRSGFDAILVGARTARIDDPRLTVRQGRPPRVPPVRVVADPEATLPLDGRLVATTGDVPVIILARPDAPPDRVEALRARGVEVLEVHGGDGVLDLRQGLDLLHGKGIRTVLCEGGGRLASELLAARRADRLYLFYAPRVLGSEAVPAFPGDARFEGRRVGLRAVGEDVLLIVDRSE